MDGWRRRAARCALAAALMAHASTARGGGGAETDPYDDLRGDGFLLIGGLADVYALHNFNDPFTQTNQLRQFDFRTDTPALNYLRLTLAHRPRRLGFRVDAGVGDTSDVYFAQDPAAARHPDAARAFSRLEQAFVTVIIPTRRRIAIEVGKFNTPVGLEDNESPTNWSYSRSLIFSFAEPTLHTGVRVTVAITDALAVSLLWTNGWNSNFLDGSDLRSYIVAATWRRGRTLEVALVYAGGLEHPMAAPTDPRLAFRNLLDAYAVWTPRSWLSIAASADYGADRAQGGVSFWGADVYARALPLRWLAFALRGEYFSDPDGFATGVAQSLGGGSVNVDVQHDFGRVVLLARGEWRHDTSTAAVFTRGANLAAAHGQDTLTLALSMRF